MSSPDSSLPNSTPPEHTPVLNLDGAQELRRELQPDPSEHPPWNIWDVLRIATVAVVSIGIFSMVALAIALHGHRPNTVGDIARNASVVIPAQTAAYLVVIAYMFALVRIAGLPFWSTIEWRFPRAPLLGYGALGIALALLVQSVSALLPIPKSLPIDQYFRDARGAYLMAAFGISLAPLVEELFFRGFMYPVIARKLGIAAGVTITAALFALIHAAQLAQAWAPLLLLWFVGLVLTSVRAWTKSVGASFCIHVGYNATLFGLMYLATDHFRHLEKLT